MFESKSKSESEYSGFGNTNTVSVMTPRFGRTNTGPITLFEKPPAIF